VLLVGHDLPWWFYVVLTVIVVLTGRQFVGRIVALRGEG
jgi:hypothetical protein